MIDARVNTSVAPYRGRAQPCLRIGRVSEHGLSTCDRPVRFVVWDSLVCADHAALRLGELLRAALSEVPA